MHAPAGAGKTLGVASFVAKQAPACIWYAIDVEDRDQGSLVAALGRALLGDLGSTEPPRLPPIPESAFEFEARRLFRLLLGRSEQPVRIVLDNFQAAEP